MHRLQRSALQIQEASCILEDLMPEMPQGSGRGPVEPYSEELRALARRAIIANDARKHEDIDKWAERLARDLVEAGEKEYGPVDKETP
jgi:hypothetical protein